MYNHEEFLELIKAKGIDNVIEYLNQELKKKPHSYDICFCLGISYSIKKNYEKAIVYLNKAIEINPKKSEAYTELGSVYNEKKEYDNAIEKLKKAIEINSKNSDAYRLLGLIFQNIGKYNNAIKYLNKAVEINPKDSLVYQFLGLTFLNKHEYDNAIKYLKKAKEINSKIYGTYFLLGITFYKKGEYDNAIKYLEKAIETNPKDLNLCGLLGIIYNQKKEYDKAFCVSLESTEKLINSFSKSLQNVFKEEKKVPIKYKKILFNVYKLWKSLQINDIDEFKEKNKDIYLYQYRKFDFLDIALKNKNFWLNPTDYQNDPNEGKAFFKYIDFENTKETNTDLVAFISCFSALEDNLIMWNSSYAQDGEGISIGVKVTKLSVGTDMLAGINIMPFPREKDIETLYTRKVISKQNIEENKSIPIKEIGLYKILYINLEGKSKENDVDREAKELLKEIKILYTKIKEENFYKKEKQKIYNWLNDLFTLVRYLIKFDDYEHEKEYRLLYIGNIKDGNYVKPSTCWNGIHIETDEILFNDEKKKDIIFIGPKNNSAIKKLKLEHYLKCTKLDRYIEVKSSSIDFR